MKISNLKWVHFIGIGSPFASFCAKQLIKQGVKVTASELNQNTTNAKYWLKKRVLYKGGHNKKYITKKIDLVVYPNGPIPNNPECIQAKKLKLKTINVPNLVGVFSKNYKTIAIAGTHGKTTTTALIIWVITNLSKTPNYIISDGDDKIIGLNKNYNVTKTSEYLVLEACEYKEQFLKRVPKPYISVVTNIDIDHTDYYKTQKQYNEAFVKFLQATEKAVVINPKTKNTKYVVSKINKKVIDYTKYIKDAKKVKSNVLPGKHNLQNIACCLAVANELGLSINKSIRILKKFKGVTRRFEYLGRSKEGNLFYKDYAHNPQKYKSLVQGVKQTYSNKKLVLIIQPHSAQRTSDFKDQLVKSFKEVDTLILNNIFTPTREKTLFDYKKIEKDFARALNKTYGKSFYYTKNFKKTNDLVKNLNNKNTNLIFVYASAGDLLKNTFKLK